MGIGARIFAKADELGQPDGAPVEQVAEQTPEQQAQPAAQEQEQPPQEGAPSASEPPQMVPVQRLSAATRKSRLLQEQLSQQQMVFQQQQQQFESKIGALEARLEELSKAQGPKPGGEDAWLEEYLESGKTSGVPVTPEMKALKEQLDKLSAWKEAQEQQAAQQAADAMLDSELSTLTKDCPNFDEETVLTMLAQGWSPERIVAKHAQMKWAPATPSAPARKPAPPPPPQIAQPGSTQQAKPEKMRFDEWLKRGFKDEIAQY